MASQTNLDPRAGAGDIVAEAAGQTNKSKIETGILYTGTVTATNHTNQTYTVQLDGSGMTLESCTWAVGFFAPFLGYRTSHYPALGTRVSVLATKPAYIVGMLPADAKDGASRSNRQMLSTGLGRSSVDNSEDDTGLGVYHTQPADLLEGEFEISNLIGTGIQFLHNLIKISGSERAKIEAHILNDMVRIVSDTFKHHSAFGDLQIYNDGRLNCRLDGTSYEHEALGLSNPNDPKADIQNRQINSYSDLIQTGRWRFSQYLGWLGDFVHLFVSDPTTTLSNIASNALRAGKARVHIGQDGTLLSQSVAEIAVERVSRIVVPVEAKRWDDPEGTNKKSEEGTDAFKSLSANFLKTWNWGKDMENVMEAGYKLREYARWLSCFHSYARFHQLEASGGEWRVPLETEATPQWHGQEDDKIKATSGKPQSFDVYACWRIMRDGSIIFWEGGGAAVHMRDGSVHISAPRHIALEAAGDITLQAGNDIHLTARRNISIAAIKGGLILKARAWFKALCEWGTMYFKSDAKDLEQDTTRPETEDGQYDADNDPKPEIQQAAIVIEASRGRMLVASESTMNIETLGQQEDTESTASINVISKKDINVKTKNSMHVNVQAEDAGDLLYIECRKDIFVRALTNLMIQAFESITLGQHMVLRNVGAYIQQLKVLNLDYPVPVTGNTLPGSAMTIDPPDNSAWQDLQTKLSTMDGVPAVRTAWKFEEDYKWKKDDKYEHNYETLAQQFIRTNGLTNYGDWNLNQNVIRSAPYTQTGAAPFPGKIAAEYVHDTTAMDVLSAPTSVAYKDMDPTIENPLSSRTVTKKFLKK